MKHLKGYNESKKPIDIYLELIDVLLPFFDENGFNKIKIDWHSDEYSNELERGNKYWNILENEEDVDKLGRYRLVIHNATLKDMRKLDSYMNEENDRIKSLTNLSTHTEVESYDTNINDVIIYLVDIEKYNPLKKKKQYEQIIEDLEDCVTDIKDTKFGTFSDEELDKLDDLTSQLKEVLNRV